MVRVVIPLPRLRHDNTPIVFVGDFGDPVPVGVVGVDGAGDVVIDARLAGGDELGDVDTDAGVDLDIAIAIANAIDDRILGDDAVGDVGADGRSISSTRLRRRSISASFDASLILSVPISVSFSANIAWYASASTCFAAFCLRRGARSPPSPYATSSWVFFSVSALNLVDAGTPSVSLKSVSLNRAGSQSRKP